MAIFRLKKDNDDLSKAELIYAEKINLELEQYLESWLERSPWALVQEPILWIGRQTTATVEGSTIFPDLLGIDSDGNLVIVELKRGHAPREVIAQLLEYAAWANTLSEDIIVEKANAYLQMRDHFNNLEFYEAFKNIFESDEVPPLNRSLRLFIIAENIPQAVSRVCRFLRTSHGLDISCIAVTIFQTESGEILVNTDLKVGDEDIIDPKHTQHRWSGEIPVKQVVWEAVRVLTKADPDLIFAPKDVAKIILEKYPTFNRNTVGSQIISDCVNHTSRHHYPGGDDRYWWIEKGKYRLYKQGVDGE